MESALIMVVAAAARVTAAKHASSAELITRAQRELQAAVDDARDAHAEWGHIGAALGIARGNAYQRYRKRASFHDLPESGDINNGYAWQSSN